MIVQYPPDPAGGVLDALREVLHALLFLPPQGTEYARAVDDLQYFQVLVLWGIGAVTLGTALWFAARYRRRGHRAHPARTPKVTAPAWLELGFAGLLLTLFIVWWVIGFGQYVEAQAEHEDAYEVYVSAKQWTFKFDYPEGRSTAGVLYLPAGRRVRLYLTSRDVIHSFFVPDFRVKQDALPGRYTVLGFEPVAPGRHRVFCAELCGTGHARMGAEVAVLAPADFQNWLETGEAPRGEETMAERGRAVAVANGCLNCHTVDGSAHLAPTWRGLYGSQERLASGDTVLVEPAYITESMMDPEAKMVAGYPPIMPSFRGQVTPAETAALIEYMRALRAPAPTPDTTGGPGA